MLDTADSAACVPRFGTRSTAELLMRLSASACGLSLPPFFLSVDLYPRRISTPTPSRRVRAFERTFMRSGVPPNLSRPCDRHERGAVGARATLDAARLDAPRVAG